MKNSIRNVTIVGGGGNFGKFIGDNLSKFGFRIQNILENSGLDESRDILSESDIIIFAVPISKTIDTIKSLSEHITGDKLVIDVTGLKSGPTDELSKLDVSEIVGTHPMFGQFINSLSGKKIIVSKIKSGKKWEKIERFLRMRKVNLIKMGAEEHDKKMAVIQALTHIINLVFIKTIKDLGFHPEELEQLETPIYKLQALISGRFLNQSGALYSDMQIRNDFFINEVLPVLNSNLSLFSDIDISRDTESFIDNFSQLSDFLGEDFRGKAVDLTKKIDGVVN